MISTAVADAWLATNARECERFELRLSAEGCAKIAAEFPLRCEGCEHLAGLPAVTPAEAAVAGRRSKMRPAVARQKSQRGGNRRAAVIAQRKAEAAAPAPEPPAVEPVTVVFSGEDA